MGGWPGQGFWPREAVRDCAIWEGLRSLGRALSARGDALADQLVSERMGVAAAVPYSTHGAGGSAASTILARGIKDSELPLPCTVALGITKWRMRRLA